MIKLVDIDGIGRVHADLDRGLFWLPGRDLKAWRPDEVTDVTYVMHKAFPKVKLPGGAWFVTADPELLAHRAKLH